jgi:hypothetical protein
MRADLAAPAVEQEEETPALPVEPARRGRVTKVVVETVPLPMVAVAVVRPVKDKEVDQVAVAVAELD